MPVFLEEINLRVRGRLLVYKLIRLAHKIGLEAYQANVKLHKAYEADEAHDPNLTR